jgi:hypothetical protein
VYKWFQARQRCNRDGKRHFKHAKRICLRRISFSRILSEQVNLLTNKILLPSADLERDKPYYDDHDSQSAEGQCNPDNIRVTNYTLS